MPLSAGYPTLIDDLEAAYQTAKDDGTEDDADADGIVATLADDIGTAIHTYMETALVTTAGTINPGQMTTMTAGTYTTPGATIGTGEITFPGGDVDTLKGDIETAHLNAKADGTEDGADSDAIIATLASDMMTAIHTFALTAEVETDVTLTGGAVVAGTIVGTAVVPGTSLPGTGEGEGSLS